MSLAINEIYQNQPDKVTNKLNFSKTINSYIKQVFKGKHKKGDIPSVLFDETVINLEKAVNEGFGVVEYGEPNYDFQYELKHNVAVFTAFKGHAQNIELVEALTDDNGKLRNFNDYQKTVKPITQKYNSLWLEAEYDIAVKASRGAAQWKEFERTAELYPNLEYLPSTAGEQREEHKAYYGMIKPITDPVWDTLTPPNGWGCNCSLRKSRKTPDTNEVATLKPIPGIAGNSGKSGQLFTANHPYVKNTTPKARKSIQNQLESLEKVHIEKSALQFASKSLKGKSFQNLDTGNNVSVSMAGVQRMINAPHKELNAKNLLVFDLQPALEKSTLKASKKYQGNDNKISKIHYLEVEIKGKSSYLVTNESKGGKWSFYSIVENV